MSAPTAERWPLRDRAVRTRAAALFRCARPAWDATLSWLDRAVVRLGERSIACGHEAGFDYATWQAVTDEPNITEADAHQD